jgi:hypothetical protein
MSGIFETGRLLHDGITLLLWHILSSTGRLLTMAGGLLNIQHQKGLVADQNPWKLDFPRFSEENVKIWKLQDFLGQNSPLWSLGMLFLQP